MESSRSAQAIIATGFVIAGSMFICTHYIMTGLLVAGYRKSPENPLDGYFDTTHGLYITGISLLLIGMGIVVFMTVPAIKRLLDSQTPH